MANLALCLALPPCISVVCSAFVLENAANLLLHIHLPQLTSPQHYSLTHPNVDRDLYLKSDPLRIPHQPPWLVATSATVSHVYNFLFPRSILTLFKNLFRS